LAFEQALHLPSHLASQQTPSTQKPDWHWLLAVPHAVPAVFFAAQVVPLQYVLPTHSASVVQLRLQPVAAHTFGAHVSVVAAPQVPRPSHVRADR
jgi:hypothetical protein